MSLLTKLFSPVISRSSSNTQKVVHLQADGSYEMQISGEEGCQAALEELGGPRQPGGVRQFEVARLVLDHTRAYHTNRNVVRVEIRGHLVGYLSLDATIQYRRYLAAKGLPYAHGTCPAMIWGGWLDPDGSQGPYYVSLDMPDLTPAQPISRPGR